KQDRFVLSNAGDVFDAYSKIPNASECHDCHAASNHYIARLETELYLQNLSQYIKKEQVDSIVSAVISILLIIGVMFMFLMVYVDRPISQLIRSMQHVESGDFNVVTHITSSNEMKLLSTNF